MCANADEGMIQREKQLSNHEICNLQAGAILLQRCLIMAIKGSKNDQNG